MIVVDASALVELLLGLPGAAAVARRIALDRETLHGPHLLTAEVAQVVRRYERNGNIDAARGAAALDDAADLDVNLYDHIPLLARVWEIRHNVSAYDALYLALAEALDAPLLTTDRRLLAAPAHHAAIEVVAAA